MMLSQRELAFAVTCLAILTVWVIAMLACSRCSSESMTKTGAAKGGGRQQEEGFFDVRRVTPLPTVAIVTMTRDPTDIEEWLNYHMLMGVSRFYVRLETHDGRPDDVSRLLESYPQVHLRIGTPRDVPAGFDDPDLPGQTQMLRQRAWVRDAIAKARDDRIDWIVHIDSDELLACKGAIVVPEAILRDAGSRDDVQTMSLRNHEAVLPRDRAPRTAGAERANGCFLNRGMRDCDRGECASYANGKGLGRVSKDLHEWGVHRLRYLGSGNDAAPEMSAMWVQHFESCDFPKYKDKFLKLATSETLKFPFPYYNDSISAARSPACRAEAGSRECATGLAAVYDKYRTTP